MSNPTANPPGSPAPDPPPIGTGTRAFHNLFDPSVPPGGPSSDATISFDMRILTWRAVEIRGDIGKGQFQWEDFALAVQEEFGLQKTPDRGWCVDAISKINHVIVYPNNAYKVQTG